MAAKAVKFPYAIKDGILTMSDPDFDRHVDLAITPELSALSPEDFEERVLKPAAHVLEFATPVGCPRH